MYLSISIYSMHVSLFPSLSIFPSNTHKFINILIHIPSHIHTHVHTHTLTHSHTHIHANTLSLPAARARIAWPSCSPSSDPPSPLDLPCY